jgi:hypothetical protein
MVTVSELYNKRDKLNKALLNTYDLLDTDLLNNTLMAVNCKIIKMLIGKR